MSRLLIKTLLLVGLCGMFIEGRAFSLLGPFGIDANGTVWQVLRIGYNEPGDIGGPMNAAAGEEYRWNTPTVFYAYDAPFLDFFGTRGAEEVEKAVQIVNDLPAASQINVDDYPMTTERVNFRAAAIGLQDLKSWTMKTLLEEMGVASPERWVYCLRNRYQPPPGRFPVFFTVIRRNFDPVTAAETPYINGRLWTYIGIVDSDNLPPGSLTINSPADPLDVGRFDPVAAANDLFAGFGVGSYFSGLTRDDVGAVKFIYQSRNWNFEAAPPGSTSAGFSIISGGGGGGPWTIPSTNVIGNTNVVGSTNGLADPVLRPGIDKVNFVRGEYDSVIGAFFTPITNIYVDTFMSNGVVRSQKVQRVLTVPDVLFTAADLNGPDSPPGIPIGTLARTTTAGWQNDDALGGRAAAHSGPGTIVPSVQITYNNVGFITVDVVPGVLGPDVVPWFLWGAFDGSTNDPVVFSQGGNVTLQQVEQLRLGR